MPVSARWRLEATKEHAVAGKAEGKWGETGAENIVRCLRIWPDRFEAAGLPRPEHARDVTAEMVTRWKADPWGPGHYHRAPRRLRQTTAFQALWILRGFLRHCRAPVAELDGLWRAKRGDATRRRWFDGAALDRLHALAGREDLRLVVALAGWAGLRRREICLLRVGDVDLDMRSPSLTVSRKGGRRQVVPIARSVANALRPLVFGRVAADPVYPRSYSSLGCDLTRLGRHAGLGPVSAHDLRRTFGRVLYYERGCDINSIRVLYGHSSTEMTLYYIGASMDALRSTVETLDRRPRQPQTTTPLEAP